MAPLEEIQNGVKPRKSHLKEKDCTNRRPSPKSKPLNERQYKPPKPIQRIEQSYTRERKIEVLMFREHYRVLDTRTKLPVYRQPTFEQTAAFWKIPDSTIQGWWNNQDTIIGSKSGTRQIQTKWICMWLEMEKKLYTKFIQRRAVGIIVC